MKKIRKISFFYRIFFQLIFFLLPFAAATYWIFFNSSISNFATPLPMAILNGALAHNLFAMNVKFSKLMIGTSNVLVTTSAVFSSVQIKFFGFLITMLPMAVIMYGVHQLVKLFKLYGQAIIFSQANILCFRNIGFSIFAWVISTKIYDILITYLLTHNNPPAYQLVTTKFGTQDLVVILTGFIILLISWIMNEGRKLKEENDQMI